MATSSITHNFVISPEGSKRFAESLEHAEKLASIPIRMIVFLLLDRMQ